MGCAVSGAAKAEAYEQIGEEEIREPDDLYEYDKNLKNFKVLQHAWALFSCWQDILICMCMFCHPDTRFGCGRVGQEYIRDATGFAIQQNCKFVDLAVLLLTYHSIAVAAASRPCEAARCERGNRFAGIVQCSVDGEFESS
jgi:hypothetical protein